MSFFVMQLV